MTEDDINRLSSDLETLKRARRDLDAAITAKNTELNEAREQHALANPHPLLGKQVERQVRHGYRGGTITRRGTVTIYNHRQHRGVRGIAYDAKPGDLIVVSKSGSTAYKFDIDPRWFAKGETEWKESSK